MAQNIIEPWRGQEVPASCYMTFSEVRLLHSSKSFCCPLVSDTKVGEVNVPAKTHYIRHLAFGFSI
jgi:hypothetical protein